MSCSHGKEGSEGASLDVEKNDGPETGRKNGEGHRTAEGGEEVDNGEGEASAQKPDN
jgi:hypothetical protein